MTFHQVVTRLSRAEPAWSRRVCVLAARLYLGVDNFSQYDQGIMVTARGNPLLSRFELRQVSARFP